MKRGVLFAAFALSLVMISFVSAACNLDVQLLNQDPYPAVPGDYVKLVFQVSGLQSIDCKNVAFQLVPDYPISFDPGTSSTVIVKGGTYSGTDFSSSLVVPFKVRVDPNALDGNNPIEVKYTSSTLSNSTLTKQFNLAVNNTKTDFDVFVKNYDFSTNTMTLEILNIGKNDVEALAMEIPDQPNFTVKGPNMNVVGSLDSNDYTTADFEVSPNKGNLSLTVYYNDAIGVRRSVNKTVYFNPEQFQDRKVASSSNSALGYIIFSVIVVAVVAYFFYRRHKKNKKKKLLRE